MSSIQPHHDITIQSLRTSFDAQVDAIYEATYSPKVRHVLASGGIPVLAQGSPHTPGTLGPGWGFHADEAFVKALISRDIMVAMGLVPPTHCVDLKSHVASIGDVHGACSARLLADKVRLQGPSSENNQPFTNVFIDRLIKAVVQSIESKPSELIIRDTGSTHANDGSAAAAYEIVEPPAEADQPRVQFLLTNAGRAEIKVIGRTATDGLFSTSDRTWAADGVDLPSTLPIRYAPGTYMFATEFVFVTSRISHAHDGTWLSEFLSRPSPWVAEHVLPRLRMRQMLQVSLAQSIPSSSSEDRRASIIKMVATPDLPALPAAVKTQATPGPRSERPGRCRI